jgi:hypothetical protein
MSHDLACSQLPSGSLNQLLGKLIAESPQTLRDVENIFNEWRSGLLPSDPGPACGSGASAGPDVHRAESPRASESPSEAESFEQIWEAPPASSRAAPSRSAPRRRDMYTVTRCPPGLEALLGVWRVTWSELAATLALPGGRLRGSGFHTVRHQTLAEAQEYWRSEGWSGRVPRRGGFP